jgi:hypothetical protein
MMHELRTYTIRAGGLAAFVEVTRKIGLPIRQDKYGVLRGYWTTLHGPLSRVLHLWEYPNLNERTKARAAMNSDPRWLNEFIPFCFFHHRAEKRAAQSNGLESGPAIRRRHLRVEN